MKDYRSMRVEDGLIRNRFGCTQKSPVGSFTVVDENGPIRTHDGFASFDTEKQANWCAELMRFAHYNGEAEKLQAFRDLLGIEADDQ